MGLSPPFWPILKYVRRSLLVLMQEDRYQFSYIPSRSKLLLQYLPMSTVKCAYRRAVGTNHPQRTTQPIRAMALRACQGQPSLVYLLSLARIHIYITVAIPRVSCLDLHLLVPAMHAADRVGMDREGQVLMHASLAPENASRVRVIALERTYSFQVPQAPYAIVFSPQRCQRRSPAIRAGARLQTPASEVMRAGNYARPDAIGQPCSIDVVANLGR